MYPFYFVRTHDEQDRLYAKGVTKAKGGESPHNYGCAVDQVHYSRYWDLTKKEWAVIGLIGKEVARRRNIKIVWGGDWGFYDPAHWELRDWRHYRAAAKRHEELYGPTEDHDYTYYDRLRKIAGLAKFPDQLAVKWSRKT